MRKLFAILFLILFVGVNTRADAYLHFCDETQFSVLVETGNNCVKDLSCQIPYEVSVDEYNHARRQTINNNQDAVREKLHYVVKLPHPIHYQFRGTDSGPWIYSAKFPIYLANRVFLI